MKRMTLHEKRQMAVVDLINKMFEVSGHEVTYDDIKDRKDEWYLDWGMTYEQNKEWVRWGIEYLRNNLKMTKALAQREMAMISLMWGLKFLDIPKQ